MDKSVKKIFVLLIIIVLGCLYPYIKPNKTETPVPKPVETNKLEKWGDGKVMVITEKEFCEQIADYKRAKNTFIGKGPSFILVCATWCKPCREFVSIYEEMARVILDVRFYKLDWDKNQDLVDAYEIKGIPFLLYGNESELKEIEREDMIEEVKKLNPKVIYAD